MKEFEHKYTRRMKGHDYKSPCLYHLIIKKAPGAPAFGTLTGDCRIAPGSPGSADVMLSDLGKIIVVKIYELRLYEPNIQVYQYKIMPDHVHILLRVLDYMQRALGSYIGGMKTGIAKLWMEKSTECGDVVTTPVFESGFTDKILFQCRNLDTVFRYIRENPHRLAMRRQYPDFFKRARKVLIDGKIYEAYGNLFHLRNPFKKQVVVHRANTQAETDALFEEWLEEAKSGGVLVSPFISPLEKKIRKAALEAGGRIIHIQKDSFGERYKPAESDFNLCGEGRLLIIAPLETMGKDLTREICLKMNKIAEAIVEAAEIKAK